RNQLLDVTGNLGPTSLNTAGDIVQNWRDMNNLRLGMEYTGAGPWTLRAGYVYTTQVIPSDHARATFSVPGLGHTFTVGASRPLRPGLDLNLALEYSNARGSGLNMADGITSAHFESRAFGVHTGIGYRF
ncbi:MAG: outer membrane protein transport protein, partial [Armatimonadota bacterium]|nr:outer membrane protein transport protein [Armatimonadota bacterium]